MKRQIQPVNCVIVNARVRHLLPSFHLPSFLHEAARSVRRFELGSRERLGDRFAGFTLFIPFHCALQSAVTAFAIDTESPKFPRALLRSNASSESPCFPPFFSKMPKDALRNSITQRAARSPRRCPILNEKVVRRQPRKGRTREEEGRLLDLGPSWRAEGAPRHGIAPCRCGGRCLVVGEPRTRGTRTGMSRVREQRKMRTRATARKAWVRLVWMCTVPRRRTAIWRKELR